LLLPANAVRYTGANPVFADITDLENLNISPSSIEKRISPRTRAIVVVHYGGYACDMPRILEIAQKHRLAVIEDAAHAAGSSLEGKALGTWGEVGCFSFFSNKNLTTGEGGMLVTNRDDLAEKLRLFRSHGMTSMTWDRHKGHAWSYDVVALGYNYRIDEIRSALGRVQLAKLEKNNNLRRHFVDLYGQLLGEQVPEIMIPFRYHPGISSAHIMPVLLPEGVDRKSCMEQLKSKGIQTSIHYPPVHTFSAFRDQSFSFDLPLTETVARREVTLPLYPTMTDENVRDVVSAVKEALSIETPATF
jgi:dTDP-4-amino-4,6-dideoxygalactose transaminase